MRLLLVEDETQVAGFIARGLRERAYAVDVAVDGEEALYQASISTYDAIILDLLLPKIGGLAVCRELRTSGVSTPVLMLTARDTLDDRIAGLDIGADDYLTKPFAFDELLARLRAILRRGGVVLPHVITIASLIIDTHAQHVTHQGRVIRLTTKEYALLEFLARNAGRIVGRAEISEHVWDESYDPFTNLIDVYIGRLRRKFDCSPAPTLIQTRRGLGYILVADAGSLGDSDERVDSESAPSETPEHRRGLGNV